MSEIFVTPTVSIELTYRCNHKCLFCYCPWLRHKNLIGTELAAGDWKKILDFLAAEGAENISFTGGEPLLKKDVKEILIHAAQLPFSSVAVFSNGTLVDEKMLDLFKEYNIIWDTSLPGIFSFKKLTLSPSSVSVLLEKIRLATQKKVQTAVGITVTRKNLWETGLTALIAASYGVKAVEISPCMPEGNALENPQLILSDKQYKRLCSLVSLLEKFLKIPVYFCSEQHCECFDINGTPTLSVPESCAAGKKFMAIGPDGGVRKCLHAPEKIAYIHH